jgi:hypothetical protein
MMLVPVTLQDGELFTTAKSAVLDGYRVLSEARLERLRGMLIAEHATGELDVRVSKAYVGGVPTWAVCRQEFFYYTDYDCLDPVYRQEDSLVHLPTMRVVDSWSTTNEWGSRASFHPQLRYSSFALPVLVVDTDLDEKKEDGDAGDAGARVREEVGRESISRTFPQLCAVVNTAQWHRMLQDTGAALPMLPVVLVEVILRYFLDFRPDIMAHGNKRARLWQPPARSCRRSQRRRRCAAAAALKVTSAMQVCVKS